MRHVNFLYQLQDSYALWRSESADSPSSYRSFPEPRSRGLPARGFQYVAGNFFNEGTLIEAPKASIWDVETEDIRFQRVAHGFEWLDDLVAAGSLEAHSRARMWMHDWFLTDATHSDPLRWQSDIAAARLLRLVNHGIVVLFGGIGPLHDLYFASIAKHISYLRRVKKRVVGAQKIELLVALFFASYAIEKPNEDVTNLVKEIGDCCAAEISMSGLKSSRKPEDLLHVFSLLSWAARVIETTKLTPNNNLLQSIIALTPCLRALRLGNGTLATFLGGGAGMPGRLDQALLDARNPTPAKPDSAEGFLRLQASGTTLIADRGGAESTSHCGAFEMAVGRYLFIRNMGAGAWFGQNWAQRGALAKSHSTLSIDRYAKFNEMPGPKPLSKFIRKSEHISASFELAREIDGKSLQHQRILQLSHDGHEITGQDIFLQNQIDAKKVQWHSRISGLTCRIHFHLDPSVEAQVDLGNTHISFVLPNGDIWSIRQEGGKLALRPSVILAADRMRTMVTQQVQISFEVTKPRTSVNWILERIA